MRWGAVGIPLESVGRSLPSSAWSREDWAEYPSRRTDRVLRLTSTLSLLAPACRMAQRQEQPRRSEETSGDTLGSRNSLDMKDWECVSSDEVKVALVRGGPKHYYSKRLAWFCCRCFTPIKIGDWCLDTLIIMPQWSGSICVVLVAMSKMLEAI